MEQIHNEGSNHVIVKKICKIRFFFLYFDFTYLIFFLTLSTVFLTIVKGSTCHKKLANLYIFNSYNLQGVPFENLQKPKAVESNKS